MSATPELEIRRYGVGDEAAVVALWRRSQILGPSADPVRDIRAKLAVQPELFFVGTLRDRIVATAMAGYDGHRGWIYYLGVDPARQRQGFGRRMLEAVELELRRLGCSKLNLQVRASNEGAVGFYEKLGFAVEERVSMGKRLT